MAQMSKVYLTAKGEAFFLALFKTKGTRAETDKGKAEFNAQSSDAKEWIRNFFKPVCNQFYDTEEYKSGDTEYGGYAVCCEILGFCGGVSGWIIFLIILLILGMCASGAAAFWFFYWKRKNGGQESIEENTAEDTNKSTIIEVSIDTY